MKKTLPWILVAVLAIALVLSNFSTIKSAISGNNQTKADAQGEKNVTDERIVGEWWAAYNARNETHTLKFVSGGMGYDLLEEAPEYDPFEWYACGNLVMVKYSSLDWQIFSYEYNELTDEYVLKNLDTDRSFDRK